MRIVVSLALLGFVVHQVDWQRSWVALSRADWPWLAFGFLAFNASICFAARRWQLIVSASTRTTVYVRTAASLRATYASLWLSNFLPSAFGGDIARVIAAHRSGAQLPVALATAVLDRLIGLTTAAILLMGSEAFLHLSGRQSPFLFVSMALVGVLGLSLAAVVATARMRLPSRWRGSRWARSVARFMDAVQFLTAPGRFGKQIVSSSILAVACGYAAYWGAARCVTRGLGSGSVIAAATLGTLASALPVSLNGWGVREGTVAAVLSRSGGLSLSEAGLVALLNGLVVGLTSLLGLGALLLWKELLGQSKDMLRRREES